MDWPAFLPNQLIVGNKKSNVAIICAWTTREKTLKDLQAVDSHILAKVAAIGNLYSAERGIDMVLRNILAHPHIDTIIFTGKDLSGAVEPFEDIIRDVETGFRTDNEAKYWFWKNSNLRIGGDIPEDVLMTCRKSLFFLEESFIGNVPAIADRVFKPGKEVRVPQLFPPLRPDAETLPAPRSVHPIRVDTISEGYLELLYQIMTFGHTTDTHYDQRSKELMNLVVTIENEPAMIQVIDEGFAGYVPIYNLPEFIPFDKDHLADYTKTLIRGERDENVTYNYGHLMREHFGVDQMIETAEKLAGEPDARSAVIGLWDPKIKKSRPCLNHIWFRIIDHVLYMTCIIRSNDMFHGWPENAFGLRALHEWMRSMTIKLGPGHASFMDYKSLALGDLTIISQSAHLYEDCWDGALALVEKCWKPKTRFDAKGNFIINDTGPVSGHLDITKEEFKLNRYQVQLVAPTGEVVLELHGPTPNWIRKEIDKRRLISDVGHALWIGYELGKMEGQK